MGIISESGSFQGRFGDHFRVGDHFGVGIISGAVQYTSTGADVCSQTEMEVGTWVMVNCNELS